MTQNDLYKLETLNLNNYNSYERKTLEKFLSNTQEGFDCVTGYALTNLTDNELTTRIENIIFNESNIFSVNSSSLPDFDNDFLFTPTELFSCKKENNIFISGFDQENNFLEIPISNLIKI